MGTAHSRTSSPGKGKLTDYHPDISELISLIAFARGLVVAEASGPQPRSVVITSAARGSPSFSFKKTDAGYLLERTK